MRRARSGLLVFLWGAVSWMVLPWHERSLRGFADKPAVIDAIRQQSPASGIYLLPNPRAAADPEQGKARMRQGPMMFAAVNLEGADPDSMLPYLATLLVYIAAACLISLLLFQSSGISYAGRVLFVVLAGLVVGLLGHAPNLIWWGFAVDYTLLEIADLIIGWLLAGLAIAYIIGRKAISFR